MKLLPSSFLLLPFIIFATANAAGYRFGASDQAFYEPSVLRRLDPALFPRDTPLLNTQAQLTFADETIGAIARVSGLSIPALFAALYVVTLALIGCAALLLGRTLFYYPATSLALVAAMSLRHAIARAGTNTLEGYFHPRQLAFGLGALAIAAFMHRRYATQVVLLAAAALLHPTTTLWLAIWLYVAAVVAEPRWRLALGVAAIAALPLAWWAFAAGPLRGRLVTMDAEWLAALGEKDYLFPLEWPLHAWVFNLGYAVIIAAAWRLRGSAGLLRPPETALAAGCLALLGVFGVALILQSNRVALAIQLQPARVFWMLDFLATIYLVWLLAEGPRRTPSAVRAAVAAGLIALFSVARGLYIMRVQFPDRPLAEVAIRDDDWGRAMVWARSTDRATGWLAHPLHAARYGTSVRVAAERDVFVEPLKDAALGMYDRTVAMRTRDRIAQLSDFDNMNPADARRLAAAYDLDFLVTERALDLPVVFQSGPLRVYRIGD
jgi:hypothetical protein